MWRCLSFWLLGTVFSLTASNPIDTRADLSQAQNTYLLGDDQLQNEETADFSNLLAKIKADFLKSLNLSASPGLPGQRPQPPEYMLDLYNRFANDRTARPSSNVIRSFKSEGLSVGNQTDSLRIHDLLFNVSVPPHEEITMAELRLFTLVNMDQRTYQRVERKVTIYEVNSQHDERTGNGSTLKKLAERQLPGRASNWETFDLTEAVMRWSKVDSTTHRLEMHIESVETEKQNEGSLDIDMKPETNHVPLLIVFSDDRNSIKKEAIEELEQMIDHEKDVAFQSFNRETFSLSEETLLQRQSNMLYDTSSRIRRSAKGSYCKRSPLYVEFKDIGWDSWIIAPSGYEAYECKGFCYYPLTEQVTPTKHAIVQTLVNLRNPKMAAKACCVPTKLDPISILYVDNAGAVTYKFKYEGMVVAECGCR
ncbi:bone morphogenetic protein 10 [Hemiscyllium ocellatum]|uniref:bone morphogenetic protein 10 n=1 Tax=Hemiscyllium ocellatum TaxID=170820 RepID=UPI0029660B73|nr:bone morphogenetic protein 10 [Hemiscyllium ocellatum]